MTGATQTAPGRKTGLHVQSDALRRNLVADLAFALTASASRSRGADVVVSERISTVAGGSTLYSDLVFQHMAAPEVVG